jgi:hypothetical protein
MKQSLGLKQNDTIQFYNTGNGKGLYEPRISIDLCFEVFRITKYRTLPILAFEFPRLDTS